MKRKTSRRLYRAFQKYWLWIVMPLAILAGTEAILRQVEPSGFKVYRQLFVPADDPELSYTLRPNFTYVDTGSLVRLKPVTVTTNPEGFRGPTFSTEPDDKIVEIVIAGDSIIFGSALGDEDTIANQLNRMIEKKHPDVKSIVYNLGVAGYSLRDVIRTLELTTPKIKPDLIVAAITHNDLVAVQYMRRNRITDLAGYLFGSPRWAIARFMGRQLIMWTLFDFPIEKLSDTTRHEAEVEMEGLLHRLEQVSESSGAKVLIFLFTCPELVGSAEGELYEEVITRKTRFPLLQVGNGFDAKMLEIYGQHKNDPHPNTAGAGLIAETLFRSRQIQELFATNPPAP